MTELHAPPRPGDQVFPPPSVAPEIAPAGPPAAPTVAPPAPPANPLALDDARPPAEPDTSLAAAHVPLVQPMTLEGFSIPSLPTGVPAVSSPIDTPAPQVPSHHPSREVLGTPVTPFAPSTVAPRRVRARTAPRSIGITIVTTAFAIVAGALAHIGYERYVGDATSLPFLESLNAGDLTAWGVVDPPAVRYVDASSTIERGTERRQVDVHLDLTNGDRIASVTIVDGTVASAADVDVRGPQAMVRATGGEWTPVPVEQAVDVTGTEWFAGVLTVSDVLPVEILEHTTVLEMAERQLTLGAIAPRATSRSEIRAASGAAVAAPTDVWQYRVLVDVDRFRQADPAAHRTWQDRLGSIAQPRLEVWVDDAGVVRRISTEIAGAIVTHTLESASATSDRFAADPATTALTEGE